MSRTKALENILEFLQTLPEDEESEAGEGEEEKMHEKAEPCEVCEKEPCECKEGMKDKPKAAKVEILSLGKADQDE